MTALFGFLPEVVIPRVAIETVAAMAKDPLRRARQAKPDVFFNHELVVLMGTWTPQRELAAQSRLRLVRRRVGCDSPGDARGRLRSSQSDDGADGQLIER